MTGVNGLLDSNILIYLSKGIVEFGVLTARYDSLNISRITHMEVLGFPFKSAEEELWVRKLVDKFDVLEITPAVGERTILIRKKGRIKLPDAIILATAAVNDCELVTVNEKDFVNFEGEAKIFNPLKKSI